MAMAMAMTATKKFLFEKSFDKVEVPEEPERFVPTKPPLTMTEEQFEAARAQSFAEGRAAGAAEAQASAEAVAAQALARIEERMTEACAALDAAKDATKRDAVQAAMLVVRKLAPGFAKNADLAEIEALVSSSLGAVLDEPRVVVRVHDSLLDVLKERIAALSERSGFGGRIVLIADENLGAADCRVEWADGGAERDTEWMWKQIEDVVGRFLSGLSVPAPGGTLAAAQPNAKTE